MNLLKLERVDQGRVWYLYQPEGKGEFGEVVFHFASAAPTVAKAAPQDAGSRYGIKAAAKVAEFVEKKNLPMEYIQAWY